MSPRTLYRSIALAEMITWTLLLIGLVLKYVTHTSDLGVRIGGGVHGFVFLCYVVGTCFVWVNQKWPASAGVWAVVSSVIPYATVPTERSMERRGLLDGGWRLRAGGEAPRGFLEHLQALVLRRTVLSLVAVVVVVAAVFTVLLRLGPPTQWFS